MIKIGVLADTHVNDRVRRLHPQILPLFQKAGVSIILHAGDICSPRVIAELETIAPVHVVQGNADVLRGRHFPLTVNLALEGVQIAMTHGQGTFLRYVRDRIRSIVFGPPTFRYFEEQVVRSLGEDADVLIFGHIHAAVNRKQNGQLLFNPGSASLPIYRGRSPSIGILTIANGTVEGEIVFLEKMQITDLTPAMRMIFWVRKLFGKVTSGLDFR